MNFLKNTGIKLSLVAAVVIAPLTVDAATFKSFLGGSSESTSVAFESPNYEGQLVRINTGINLMRINTDLLERMPVSADAVWIDKVTALLPKDDIEIVNNLKEVKEDAYYSTVGLTNAFLGRRTVRLSPIGIELYYQASVIYKNESNGNPDFHIPDMNQFPNISDVKSFVTFKEDPKVKIIDIEAKTGFYKNVVEAVISLLPEDLQEDVIDARKEMKNAQNELDLANAKIAEIEAWLDDDKNANAPELAQKNKDLELAKVEKDKAEKIFEEKEETYLTLLEKATEAISSDYDPSKVALAKKLAKLLDKIDDNAIAAISLFTSATAGIVRGLGAAKDEMNAIAKAQQLTTLLGNQKQFLVERYARMATGTLMAIPNITIGTYKAFSQSHEISKYQDIVKKILEAAKAEEEANKKVQTKA